MINYKASWTLPLSYFAFCGSRFSNTWSSFFFSFGVKAEALDQAFASIADAICWSTIRNILWTFEVEDKVRWKEKKKEEERIFMHLFTIIHGPCLLCAWLSMIMCICTCLGLSVIANASVCVVCWCVGVYVCKYEWRVF